uniref:Uncharacterized protein n=1 Tax=Arundo donax TaxID=35708 RepID=A0A0A8ZN66_ARUDO
MLIFLWNWLHRKPFYRNLTSSVLCSKHASYEKFHRIEILKKSFENPIIQRGPHW